MEGSETAQRERAMGRDLVAGATVGDEATWTVESATLHRELAVGNFFVELRGLVRTATTLCKHLLDAELEDQRQRASRGGAA